MNRIKIMTAVALLFGATQVMAQYVAPTPITGSGLFYYETESIFELDCGIGTEAKIELLSVAADVHDVDDAIECKVNTNEPAWDLTIIVGGSSGPFLVGTKGGILVTDQETYGDIVVGVEYVEGDKPIYTITDPEALTNGTGTYTVLPDGSKANNSFGVPAVHFENPGDLVGLLAGNTYVGFGADGEVKDATFKIRGGIRGNTVLSGPDRYEANVEVTLVGLF